MTEKRQVVRRKIGEIKEIPNELNIEWMIPNFDLSNQTEAYTSPYFSFAGKSWVLWIYPNARSEYNSVGRVSIYLVNRSSSPTNYKVALGLKIFGEKKNKVMLNADLIGDGRYTYGVSQYLTRSDLLQRKSEFLHSNTLTVLCSLKYSEFHKCLSNITAAKCSKCKDFVDAKDISAHEEKCISKTINCPECNCLMAKENATEKLLGDLKNVMVSGDHSDTTIQVKGVEFQLHKTILGARSHFFDSMFKTDMKEKKTGIVTIDDCQPDVFRSFIHFLYTGEVDALSAENVCDLFIVADKYQENQLKEYCLQFMINSISVENFCDYIIVALQHDEKELLENATKFFAGKTKEIICNVKWLTFLQEYPICANELHIKALDINRS